MYYMDDIYELAMTLCGLDPDKEEEFDNSEEKVDEILYEKYGIEDVDGFSQLVKDLAKFAEVGSSPLTGTRYRGFADIKKQTWLYKIKVTGK